MMQFATTVLYYMACLAFDNGFSLSCGVAGMAVEVFPPCRPVYRLDYVETHDHHMMFLSFYRHLSTWYLVDISFFFIVSLSSVSFYYVLFVPFHHMRIPFQLFLCYLSHDMSGS